MRPWPKQLAYGFRGLRGHDGGVKTWRSDSWELSSWSASTRQKETGKGLGMVAVLKFQGLLPVRHLLQQGHTSCTFPNSSMNWGTSIQTSKAVGTILIPATTGPHLRLLRDGLSRLLRTSAQLPHVLLWTLLNPCCSRSTKITDTCYCT